MTTMRVSAMHFVQRHREILEHSTLSGIFITSHFTVQCRLRYDVILSYISYDTVLYDKIVGTAHYTGWNFLLHNILRAAIAKSRATVTNPHLLVSRNTTIIKTHLSSRFCIAV